jgi:membrane AbrB-like protein
MLRHVAETLLVAAAGGFLLDLARFPAGWLAGAMLATAAAALAGRPIVVPMPLARIFFVTVGLSIGGVVTPETLRGIATWPFSIVLVSLAMACITVSTMGYLRRLHGWDPLTAMFAAVPGGLSQVIALAALERCDLRAIAIVQTIRVVILAVGIPAGLALLGLAGPARLPAGTVGIFQAPGELAVLLLASLAFAFALVRLGFPGGLIFGPMVVAAVLHGGDFISVQLPPWVAIIGMAGLGAVNGARFANTPLTLVLQYLGAGIGAFAVSLAVAAAFATLASVLLGLPASDVVVAYAPGSVDAMMILALALHLDPVFVGAHHLARVFTVSLALPLAVRTARRAGRKPPSRPPAETHSDH